MMMNETLSAGSAFLGIAFSSLIYPNETQTSDKEIEEKVKEAEVLVRSGGYIDAPKIIQELKCDAPTANRILNRLMDKGIITPIK